MVGNRCPMRGLGGTHYSMWWLQRLEPTREVVFGFVGFRWARSTGYSQSGSIRIARYIDQWVREPMR